MQLELSKNNSCDLTRQLTPKDDELCVGLQQADHAALEQHW
jgi:hypothetical protein